jgi:hypothetical protein
MEEMAHEAEVVTSGIQDNLVGWLALLIIIGLDMKI